MEFIPQVICEGDWILYGVHLQEGLSNLLEVIERKRHWNNARNKNSLKVKSNLGNKYFFWFSGRLVRIKSFTFSLTGDK